MSRAKPRMVSVYALGCQPDTVALDPSNGTVFAANASAGTVQIINPAGEPARRKPIRERAD